MWDRRALFRIDFKIIPIILALMAISLLVIASTTSELTEKNPSVWLSPYLKGQLRWFCIGWIAFFAAAAFDYQKLRSWVWPFYIAMLILLFGLFFTTPIQNVQRWYKIPFLNMELQPSEYVKLSVVLTLSWFIEKNSACAKRLKTTLQAGLIVFIPFVLILKQPDLGTALILCPIALVLFYLGDLHPKVIKLMAWSGAFALGIICLVFLGIISHEEIKPFATKLIKEYQYERLNPETYHQLASQRAIAIGGFSGSGWGKSTFTAGKWLPASHTDSVFPAFGEEFGLIGTLFLLLLFFALISFSFQITTRAKDPFGRLLSAGITIYLAMQIIVNIGMMSGFLPITGVPLILITYGGSSVLSTMVALGVLQSVHSRRYMFA